MIEHILFTFGVFALALGVFGDKDEVISRSVFATLGAVLIKVALF